MLFVPSSMNITEDLVHLDEGQTAKIFERLWPPMLDLISLDDSRHNYISTVDVTHETDCAFRCYTVDECNAFVIECKMARKCNLYYCTLLSGVVHEWNNFDIEKYMSRVLANETDSAHMLCVWMQTFIFFPLMLWNAKVYSSEFTLFLCDRISVHFFTNVFSVRLFKQSLRYKEAYTFEASFTSSCLYNMHYIMNSMVVKSLSVLSLPLGSKWKHTLVLQNWEPSFAWPITWQQGMV